MKDWSNKKNHWRFIDIKDNKHLCTIYCLLKDVEAFAIKSHIDIYSITRVNNDNFDIKVKCQKGWKRK